MTAYLYAGIAVVGAIIGGLLTHLFDGGRYSHLESQYQALQDADDKGRADRLAIQNKSLANDLAKATAIAQGNAEVIHVLETQSAAIQADRNNLSSQLARVLTHQAGPSSGHVSESDGVAGATPATPDAGTFEVAGLLADALTECKTNNAHYGALTTQLRPQL